MLLSIYYHSIGYTPLSTRPDIFENQINLLKEKKFRFFTLQDLIRDRNLLLEKGVSGVAITFDDCFYDVYQYALPILCRHDVKATLFPVPSYFDKILWGSEKHQKWSQNYSKEYSIPFEFMGLNELKESLDYGFEIGSHSYNHKNMNEMSPYDQDQEIKSSKKFLENNLDIKIDTFCFPRGRYNEFTLEALLLNGFSLACTTRQDYIKQEGSNYEVPRFSLDNSNLRLRSILAGNGGKLSLLNKIVNKFT